MDLPVLNDNLRSSASWTTALAAEQEAWLRARAASVAIEAGETGEASLREYQVGQILQTSGDQIERFGLAEAAAKVSAWAREAGAKLDAERLLELHRTLIGASVDADVLRKTEAAPINAAHDPTPAVLLTRMIDNAFEWFAAESFAELHPVEQATVVYLRLLDLSPFPTATAQTALLAASFYTERAGLPPLVIAADDVTRGRFKNSLEAAMRMLTQPLVELFAEMLQRAMRQGLAR